MTKHKTNNQLTKHILGWAMYAVAFILPLSNLPQITKLFQTHVTSGLSIQTWVLYLIFGLIPLLYAIVNRITPLIISNFLWTIVNIVMIIGIYRFGILASGSNYETLLLINNVGKTLAGLGLISLSSAAALFAYDLLDLRAKAHRAQA